MVFTTDYILLADNLVALKDMQKEYKGKINLIYIDPPFATGNNFYSSVDEQSSYAMSPRSNIVAYSDKYTLETFLDFLEPRLELAKNIMAETGSIYVHTDYKIGHYVKVLMDKIFGIENFKNDITRVKCNPKNFTKNSFGNIKDCILFYTKSGSYTWNDVKIPYTEEQIVKLFKKKDKLGRYYTTPLHAPGNVIKGSTGAAFKGINPPTGRHWRYPIDKLVELDNQGKIEWSENNVPRKKVYLHEKEGQKQQDIWYYKDLKSPIYPTQKNINIALDIIKSSSNYGDLVLDFFCGSGTTCRAAKDLGRHFIGIDNSPIAVKVAKKNLKIESET